jgi:hypothetical protein
MATTIVNLPAGYTLDDFDETKNFHRVLFRPGYSVQARELTQLQTSLQAQIDRHGQYSFKDGSRVVNGKVTLNVEYDFVKVESSFYHSASSATLTTDNYLTEFVGTTITGATGGVTAVYKPSLQQDPAIQQHYMLNIQVQVQTMLHQHLLQEKYSVQTRAL